MTSSGMDRIYERYKASPNYVSKELLDYLCDEKEFCNFCQYLKFHYRLRHAQEILKFFPESRIENAVDVQNDGQNEPIAYDFGWKDDDEDDNDSITLSLSEASNR